MKFTMINTLDFTERLQKVIKFYDETASSFAEKIGVQRSSISHILSGRNKPSLDFVMKVLHAYPDVDLYWLMNGKGSFPSTPKPRELKITNSHPEPLTEFSNIKDKPESSDIDKIIIFYKDGSFKSYQN